MQSEKVLLGSVGTCIQFLLFLFAPLDADKPHSRRTLNCKSAWIDRGPVVVSWYLGEGHFQLIISASWRAPSRSHKSLIGLGSGEFGGQVKALGSGLSRFLNVFWGLLEHIIPTERGWRNVYRYGQLLIHENQVWLVQFESPTWLVSFHQIYCMHSPDIHMSAGDMQIVQTFDQR